MGWELVHSGGWACEGSRDISSPMVGGQAVSRSEKAGGQAGGREGQGSTGVGKRESLCHGWYFLRDTEAGRGRKGAGR